MYFLETLQVRAPCHGGGGGCCIVFDIDGMLFEFCMNFLNIESKIVNISYFTFYAIFNIQKNRNPPSVRPSVGGGGVLNFYFFRKTILSYFTFYAIFNIKNKIETPRLSVRPSVHHV